MTAPKLPRHVAYGSEEGVVLHRITRAVSRLSQRTLIFLVEDVSTFSYIMGFAIAVLLFGGVYTWLTPMGHGIGENLKPLSDITYFTGLYFSIVTISSLGYGHMHPMGISRALACIEVLIGLAIIGIMIAKVTSQRLSYHVSRLFASDAQKRLENIALQFEASESDLRIIMPKLESAYQSAPGQKTPLKNDRDTLISNLRDAIGNLQSECIKLRDYFLLESEEDNYFRSAPVSAVARVGNAIDGTFLILGQLIISLPMQARIEILDRHNRQRISEAIDSQKRVCDLVNRYATDQDTLDAFQRVEETCRQVPASYFAVPEESQPDQVLQGTDEPQELSG